MSVSLSSIFGFHCHMRHGFNFHGSKAILFISGQLCVIQSIEKNVQKFFVLPEMHHPTTMAHGPKNFLAVADSIKGRKAQVFMCDIESSMKKVMPEPNLDIEEYNCLCFSSDFKHLAAQSTAPHWAIVLWAWDKKILRSTYVPNLHPNAEPLEISFHQRDNEQIVAVGKHCFRIYKLEGEEGFKPFIFTKYEALGEYYAIGWLPRERLAIGSNDGKILMFDGVELRYEINVQTAVDQMKKSLKVKEKCEIKTDTEKSLKINGICPTARGLYCLFGENTVIEYVRRIDSKEYKYLRMIELPVETPFVQIELGEVEDVVDKLTHMEFMELNTGEDIVVTCTDRGQIFYKYLNHSDVKLGECTLFKALTQPVHKESIIALDIALSRPIMASSSKHTIILWDYVKRSCEMKKKFHDEILSLSIHPLGLYLAVGFTEYFRIFTILTDSFLESAMFDAKNCNEVSFSHSGHLLAIANGFRIEVYNFTTLKQFFVLKGHRGELFKFAWSKNDTTLISCDKKGALYVWDIISQERITEIVFKDNVYTGIAIKGKETNFYAVGEDKTLKEFINYEFHNEIPTGIPLTDLKLTNSYHKLFGATATGCLRVFRYPLTVSGAHTDLSAHIGKITAIKVVFNDYYVMTTGVDGMICLWKIKDIKEEEDGIKFSPAVLINKKNLDEYFENMKNLEIQLEEIQIENLYQMQLKEMFSEQQIESINEIYEKQIGDLYKNIEKLSSEKKYIITQHEEQIIRFDESKQSELDDLESQTRKKLLHEYNRYDDLVKNYELLKETLKAQAKDFKIKMGEEIMKLTEMYETKLKEKDELIFQEKERSKQKEDVYKNLCKRISNDADEEIREVTSKFAKDVEIHTEEINRLKEANEIAKKKISNMQNDNEALNERIKIQTIEADKLKLLIKNLESEKHEAKDRTENKTRKIEELQQQLFTLNYEKQEIEKHEFIANFNYEALQTVIEPKEQEIARCHCQIEKLQIDLKKIEKKTSMDLEEIANLKARVTATKKSINEMSEMYHRANTFAQRLQADLSMCAEIMQDPPKLKQCVKNLLQKYSKGVTKQVETIKGLDVVTEFAYQREHLEKCIHILRKRIMAENKAHRIEYVKMVEENSQLIKSINTLRQDLKISHQRIRDIEASLGLATGEFTAEGIAARQKLETVIKSIKKDENEVLAKIARKDSMIRMQQEDLRRLHALLVVKEEGKKIE